MTLSEQVERLVSDRCEHCRMMAAKWEAKPEPQCESCPTATLPVRIAAMEEALKWLAGRMEWGMNDVVARGYSHAIGRLLAGKTWGEALREIADDEDDNAPEVTR
jgi:hypothetical protein